MQTRLARWPMALILTVSLLAPTMVWAQATTDAAASTQPAADPLSLLKIIPADATAFLAVRNLKELDGDIAGIAGQLGFPMGPEGMFPAPLDWLKMSLQITAGLNENDGIAVVLLDCQNVKSAEELPDHMVMYIPASNPKELLKSLNAEETTARGIYKFDLSGAPTVAAIKGNYLVATKAPLSTENATPAALAAAMKAEGEGVVKTMSADRVQSYQKQDLFIWLNLQTISDELRNTIVDGMTEAFKGLSGQGASTQPSDQQARDAVRQAAQFIQDGEEVSVGLLLNTKVGLTASVYYRVKPDTELAKAIAAQQSVKGSLLAGLPNEAAIITFAAVTANTPEYMKQARKTIDDLAAKAQTLDPDPGSPLNAEGLKPLIDSYIALLGNSRRVAFMISDLSAPVPPKPAEKKPEGEEPAPAAPVVKPGSEGTIGLVVVAETKDSKAFKAEMKKIFDQAKELVSGIAKADGMEQAKIDNIMNGFSWQEGGATSADTVKVDLSKMPEVKAEDLDKIKKVLGPDGISFKIATVGEKHVIVVMGGGEKRLTEIKSLVEKNQTGVTRSKNIARISSRLPSGQKVTEMYLDFGHLVELVKSIATQLDTPLPMNISLKNAAPISLVTVSAGPTAQQIELLVPIELIRSGYTAITQAMMGAMMGGGTGGTAPDSMGEMKKEKPSDGSSEPDAKPVKKKRVQPKAAE